MKNSILIIGSVLASVSAQASQIDNIVNMATEQFRTSGELSAMASCVGSSEAKVLVAYRETMKFCMSKHGFLEASESALDMCMETQASKRLGVKPAKLTSCMDGIESQQIAEEEADIENMTEAEFTAYVENQREQALSQMDSMVQMSKQANKGTEGAVTLPVYSSSEIVAHYTEGFSLTPGVKGIPVATFVSKDSVDQITAFYKKALPDFDKKVFDGNMVIFMQNMPSDFDPLKDLEMFQQTPHVSIFKMPSGTETSIEVAYKGK